MKPTGPRSQPPRPPRAGPWGPRGPARRRPLTFIRPPGARGDQQLRQRQEQDQQTRLPEPHRGSAQRGLPAPTAPGRSRTSGPRRWSETGGKARNPPGSPRQRPAGGGEAAGGPIPAALGARVACASLRVGARRRRPPSRPSSPASSARPAARAFKAPSPNVRCPLLIGCAAATNQRLPLGLPGAHRLREGVKENKGGGHGPEGRGGAAHWGAIGRRRGGGGAEPGKAGRDGAPGRAAKPGWKNTCPYRSCGERDVLATSGAWGGLRSKRQKGLSRLYSWGKRTWLLSLFCVRGLFLCAF